MRFHSFSHSSVGLIMLAVAVQASAQTLLVSSRQTDEVLAFDSDSGAPLGVFVGTNLDNPVGLTFGPDGQLYVASADDDRIARFDGATGQFLGDVAAGTPIDGPREIAFGPDGDLFVGNGGTDEVLRVDPATGAVLTRYASPQLDGPTGFTFDARGDLWVGSVVTDLLLRFDVVTGVLLESRTDPLLRGPHDLSLGPDGWIYVTNAFGTAPRLLRFDPAPGGRVEAYASGGLLRAPLGLQWTNGGDLLVANQNRDEVRRFSGATSPTGSVLVTTGTGGLDGPLFLALAPESALPRVLPPQVGSVGPNEYFALDGLTPGGMALGYVGLAPATPGIPVGGGCPGLRLSLQGPRLFLSRPADASGRCGVWLEVASALAGTTLLLQGVDVSTCTTTSIARFLP